MYVTLRVLHKVARALHHRQPSTAESEELITATEELGVKLAALHPHVEDLELMRYFAVEVPNLSVAERVIKRLQQCKAIDAAYVKPPDELP
ncbi:MAG: hypothetical protein LAO21_00315 [Acidobacteriia bacterium]|nr:hypothetical protein [Terriglobia bacterium]